MLSMELELGSRLLLVLVTMVSEASTRSGVAPVALHSPSPRGCRVGTAGGCSRDFVPYKDVAQFQPAGAVIYLGRDGVRRDGL